MKKKLIVMGTVLAITVVSAQAVFAANSVSSRLAVKAAADVDVSKIEFKIGDVKDLKTQKIVTLAPPTLTATDLDVSKLDFEVGDVKDLKIEKVTPQAALTLTPTDVDVSKLEFKVGDLKDLKMEKVTPQVATTLTATK